MKITGQKFVHWMICEYDDYEDCAGHLAGMLQEGWELKRAEMSPDSGAFARCFFTKSEDVK